MYEHGYHYRGKRTVLNADDLGCGWVSGGVKFSEKPLDGLEGLPSQ